MEDRQPAASPPSTALPSANRRARVFTVLKIAFTAAILTWLLWSGRLDFAELANANLGPVSIGLCHVLGAAYLFTSHARWVIVLNIVDPRATILGTLRYSAIGWFFNFTLPSSIGGDIVKAYYVVRDTPNPLSYVVWSSLVERLLSFHAMLAVSLGALIVWTQDIEAARFAWPVGLLFTALTVGLVVLLSGRVRNIVVGLLRSWPKAATLVQSSCPLPKDSGAQFVTSIFSAYSLATIPQFAAVALIFVVSRAVDPTIPVEAYIFAVPLSFVFSAIPISIAGIGVGQVSLMFLLEAWTGTTSPAGPLAMTAFQVFMFVLCLPGLFAYLTIRQKRT